MSDKQPDHARTARRLLTHLRRLKDDRGAMADLRRALNPAQRHRAWPLLAPVRGIGKPRFEVVAGLFAYHPAETTHGNLGTTCHRLATESNSFEMRFHRLLACDRTEITARLRPVVLAARARGVEINYKQLFIDLSYWGDRVKSEWAREFWNVPESDDRGALSTTESAT